MHSYILHLSVSFVPCNVCRPRYFNPYYLSLCTPRFPLYYELKIAVVIWLLSPYTRGASLIYRKCLHPLLSSKERVRSFVPSVSLCTQNLHAFLKISVRQFVNRFWIFLPAGNRWVYCAGQRAELWDDGQFWKARTKHCSYRCRYCGCQGKSFLNCILIIWKCALW